MRTVFRDVIIIRGGKRRTYHHQGQGLFVVRPGGYKLNATDVFCSCLGFKFRPYPDKICGHLRDIALRFTLTDLLVSPLFPVEPTRYRPQFRAISNWTIRSWQRFLDKREQWYWSIKRDGIRVLLKIEGAEIRVYTRGGLRSLAVEAALQEYVPVSLWGSLHNLEGELCTPAASTTANDVQTRILHARRPVQYNRDLKIYILDVFSPQDPNTPFSQRYTRAQAAGNLCRLDFIEQHPVTWTSPIQVVQQLDEVQGQGHEGLVFQRKAQPYSGGYYRSVTNNFKVKTRISIGEGSPNSG